jgi:hypothetical protein
MTMYNVKVKLKRDIVASAMYGHKGYRKGRTYTLRRKLTPTERKQIRRNNPHSIILSVKKIKKR